VELREKPAVSVWGENREGEGRKVGRTLDEAKGGDGREKKSEMSE